jgi:hypothetical protein
MVDRASDTAIEARLNEFLSAERRRAEADYPHLLLRKPGSRRASPPLGLAVLAAVVVAAVVLVRPWGSLLPGTSGGDPIGSDGIPLSISGEPVLRGADIDERLAGGTSFLAGGYLVLHPAACDPASPTPSAGCAEDWRLEDAAGEHSVGVATVGGGATFVRTSGAATVFRVRPVVDGVSGGLGTENRRQALLIEETLWRQPTRGRIPEEATPPEGGETNMALVPDFVGVWGGPTGETIVGYVPKDLLFNPRSEPGGTLENPPEDVPMPVYGEDLTTLVGHMVAGQGFVPLGGSPAPSAAFGSPSVGPSADPWGPLAVTGTNAGMDARNEGTLVLTEQCAFLERVGERELLVWPANQTSWSPATAEISFRRSEGQVMTVRHGQRIVLGGGGSSRAEDGLAGEEWASRIDWLVAPDPSCLVDVRFLVSDVLPE